MKLKIQTKKLKEAIDNANIATLKNNQNQTLKGIFLIAENNNLIIRATNISIGYEKTIPCDTETEGKLLIFADTLSRVFSSISFSDNSFCNIEKKDDLCTIKIENHSIELKTLDFATFPELPKNEGVKVGLNLQDIVFGLKSVVFSVAKTTIKPEISGVYVYTEGSEIIFVGTDSYRLSEKKIKTKTEMPEFEFIIPEKNVKDIIRLFSDNSEHISVQLSKNSLSFETKDEYFITRLIEGKFPNYRQIIPLAPISNSTFLKEDINKSLKIVSFFSDKTEQVTLDFKENSLNISALNLDIGSANEEMKANTKGDDFSVKINSRYLEEFISNVNENSLMFKFTAQNKPVVLQGLQDSSFTYLIMPSYK
jgi:DNA polymerase III subunit beta